MAWLNATPDKKSKSRLEEMADIPPLPPNPAPYLTTWLFEIGPTSGQDILGWRDFQAWQEISGVELLPFEAKLLRHLSGQFADERIEARKSDRAMPYNMDREAVAANRKSVAAKIDALFGG